MNKIIIKLVVNKIIMQNEKYIKIVFKKVFESNGLHFVKSRTFFIYKK
jgi:hypothetical protein